MAVLLCVCFRVDGTKSSISIESGDLDTMKRLAKDIHSRIDEYIKANNLKIVVNDSTQAGTKRAVENWDQFTENMWTIRSGEISVFVPCNEWRTVADSRLS